MAESYTTHPIIAQHEEIDRRGLMVFDDITRMPLYDEPYTSPMLTLLLTHRGWMRAECDMRPASLHEHSMAVITPHRILCIRETSADYVSTVIIVSAAFLERLRHLYPDTWRIITHYRSQPELSLSDSQFQVISNMFRVLSDVSRTDSPRRTEMQEDLLKVLFLMLQEYSIANSREQNLSPREELFTRFYQAIEEHYRESHEVQFYADLFGLTPKHFAAIIKNQTGIKALTWINNYVAMQAKSMLRHMQQLSIQQVAEQTGFSEQASFSRFFKTITGKTPSEYRNQTN